MQWARSQLGSTNEEKRQAMRERENSYSEHAAPVILSLGSIHRQGVGFAAATVGWILSITSMGLVVWQVWYIDNNPLFPSSLACVGMWRVCIYHHVSNVNRVPFCYHYTSHEPFLPLDILMAQNLLLVTSLLGLLGKASIIFALRNTHMGILQKKATHVPFMASGILYVAAGICISATVVWNYFSVMKEEGISFPPSCDLPFKPDAQEVGSASVMVLLANFLLLLSGFSFLFYRFPLNSQVHPRISEL
ncbi:claudin-34-like [Choloepus didactylus]|uniref:claudin-34-like n=1 Tax=Choloepus didactylus TaxID=27675 RepID=UPI0018A07045|nr:claudin-34-like [Choloepus didactylus]